MKEIEYYRPKFTRKLAASFMDAFIFSLLSLLFVVISKALGDVTPTYKQNSSELDTIKLDSGLFLEDNDGLVRDIVTIYNLDTETNSSVVEKEVVNSINNFFTYVDNNLSHELYESMIKEFDELRLDQKLIYSYEGNTYKLFIQKDGKVVKNNEVVIPSKSYISFYKNYIDNYALGYFHSKIDRVVTLEKYFSYVMAIEVIVGVLVGSIINYYVFPLIFRRNRYTLGRLTYKIGLVNKDVLHVSFGQFTLRFLIIFFLEIALSFVTFGIPIIFSFTMSLVTKKKQYFHDYLLGIEEVDLQDNQVYYSKDEVNAPVSKDDIHNFSLK
ncbi:MAG: RDD family protein [Candidatus Onthovivens sp.]|nr:RDD family protein [Mollicutes bacterium]MDY3761890.1 RDD family protein [Candidatus Onthovivens sp.]MDY3778437.1 RDD family protein [Candidatus Onthovivens sp.]MDY5892507.1 RDD family protein [Candidatus Onthovivens sp.]